MTRAGAAGARFRQRKLSTKQTLQVLREDQVEKVEDDQQRNIPKVETGVEKGEEICKKLTKESQEHHLQAAISASKAAAIGGKVAQIYIPTPDTIQSNVHYDRLYALQFQQPATYIRFSSTVEDCSGCQYCMTDEDDAFLKSMNQNSTATPCTEDQFEQVCDFFEQTARLKQPFAAVDNPPVISFEEIEASYDETIDENVRPFAREIYDHWRSERIKQGNRPLMPSLKVRTIETGQDADDSDPYVCFRRREVRQVRKTRGRDALSTEKLKKLRKELEDARQLIAMVKQREVTRRELLAVDRNLFEQRSRVKDAKRKLGIKGDDDDLINQKPQKRKAIEPLSTQRPPGPQLRMPPRPDGRSTEADLVLLQDILAEKDNEIQRDIDQKLTQHKNWNNGYLDFTRMPLTPITSQPPNASFRTAITEFLPTPPASASSESSGDAERPETVSPSRAKDNSVAVRYASPSDDVMSRSQPSFRRRIGRGGRLMIDRRGMHLQSKDGINPLVLDRFKYDQDEADEPQVYLVDQFDTLNMRYRASILGNARDVSAHRHAPVHAARVLPSGNHTGAGRPNTAVSGGS
ncbi:MAG: Enhancer of polycomb-like protein 1 [Sclerophora amabilis]|nr:MAG: Enhancer of polycomb-like protein 1 [Sclerophora amabilis]